MAQRKRTGSATLPIELPFGTLLLLSLYGRSCQPEEGQAIPAGAGDRDSDCAKGRIRLVLIAEPFRQNLHQNRSSFPLSPENRPRQREATVLLTAILVRWSRLDLLHVHAEEVFRRDHPQVCILGNLLRPRSPLILVLMCLVIYGIWNWSQIVLLVLASIYLSSGLFIRLGGIIRRTLPPRPKPGHKPDPEAQIG